MLYIIWLTNIPISFAGETVMLPPCPILLLMSTSGELCPYRVIYQTEPMKVLTRQIESLPAEERNAGVVSLAVRVTVID